LTEIGNAMGTFDFSIIRALRRRLGLTAEELAKRANVTRATVAKIEAGAGNPTIETIESLSNVFQLTSSELIRLAETAQCERATTKAFNTDSLTGFHVWFPGFEVYVIRADSNTHKESDPRRHENTAEICLVLSGKVRVNVAGQSHELGPGMALRFKALHEHYFDVIEKAEFLLIHQNLV
jgi:transcriptional regulator with XRE-family HTH domain